MGTSKASLPPKSRTCGWTLGTRSRPEARPTCRDRGDRSRPSGGKGTAAEPRGAWYPRWYWPSFTLPGIVVAVLLFLLPFYTVLAVAFGTVDPVFRQPLPVYQPWWWSFSSFNETLQKFYVRRRDLPGTPDPDLRLRLRGELDLPGRRLRRGLLHRPIRRKVSGADLDPAGVAVLDQLPDEDLRVAKPPAAGRLRERHLDFTPVVVGADRVGGTTDHGGAGTGLRLHPFHDPAAVRVARPHQSEPARSRPGPRGQPVPDIPKGYLAASRCLRSWPDWSSCRCRCSVTTTRTTCLVARRPLCSAT